QVIALNRALNNVRHNGLHPDFDLAILQRVIDEDLGNGEIQQLVHALELSARFEANAARFAAKGDDAKAAQMHARGEALQDTSLTRIGAHDDADNADDESAEAATEAARESARDAAHDAATDEVKHVARNEAKKAAAEVAREAAQENAKKLGLGK